MGGGAGAGCRVRCARRGAFRQARCAAPAPSRFRRRPCAPTRALAPRPPLTPTGSGLRWADELKRACAAWQTPRTRWRGATSSTTRWSTRTRPTRRGASTSAATRWGSSPSTSASTSTRSSSGRHCVYILNTHTHRKSRFPRGSQRLPRLSVCMYVCVYVC